MGEIPVDIILVQQQGVSSDGQKALDIGGVVVDKENLIRRMPDCLEGAAEGGGMGFALVIVALNIEDMIKDPFKAHFFDYSFSVKARRICKD